MGKLIGSTHRESLRDLVDGELARRRWDPGASQPCGDLRVKLRCADAPSDPGHLPERGRYVERVAKKDKYTGNKLTTPVDAIFEETKTNAQAALNEDNYAEAKRVIAAGVRDLREYKRSLTDAERDIRLAAQEARLKNRQSGQTLGMFVGSKTRGAMARGRSAASRNIAAKQADMLSPYANAKAHVDRTIAALDRIKEHITHEVARLKETGTAVKPAQRAAAASAPAAATTIEQSEPTPAPAPTAPPPPPTPAQWAPDPSGKHQHRWWDGSRWSEHVADDGTPSTDPM